MRLWSINPEYLDAKGLVALWREGLLALSVLKGTTQGYKSHPQLHRFLHETLPVMSMKNYLWFVYLEAAERGYSFDREKLGTLEKCPLMKVTHGQLEFELSHLAKKLAARNRDACAKIRKVRRPKAHPLFTVVAGNVERWEVSYYRREGNGRKAGA